MKKLFYIVLAILTLSACETSWLDESKHPMPDGVGAKPEFVFEGESTISVSKLGGDYEAVIKANQPWLVESTASWIVVTSDRVGKGDGSAETVTFSVGKNPGLEPREGKIRMWITNEDEAYITIKQEPLLLEDLGNDYYVTVNGTGDGSSWANATSLSNALAVAVDADNIHVAAGTYIPTDPLPGGATGGDETFFIKANIDLIGGYPANPKDGDTPDPEKNPTILSGNETYHHCMVIGAPVSDLFSVRVNGITFTKGCGFSKATSININGGLVYRSYGAGMVITGGRNVIENCTVIDNTSEASNAGVFLTGAAQTTFRNCTITDNKGAKGNGKGVWNGPGCVTYMYDCEISKHVSAGVGSGVYNYEITAGSGTPSLYMVNCEVVGNSAGSYGGGIYGRTSNTVLVNCTIHGNSAKNGAGVMSYGAGNVMTLISCTVTGNTSTVGAAGVMATSSGKAYLNNSVVAGNLLNGADNDVDGAETPVKSAVGGGAGMFGTYNNGVYPLVSGAGLNGGMTVDELKKVSTNCSITLVPEDVEVDQKGNKRTGTMMGAYVGK